jgi:hypothetical protein
MCKRNVLLFLLLNIRSVVGYTQPAVTTIAHTLEGPASDIKMSTDTNTLFVSNLYANVILAIDTQTYNIWTLVGNSTNSGFADGPNGIMDRPVCLVFLGTSDLLVSDYYNNRIRIISILNENQEIQTWAGNGIYGIVDNPDNAKEASIPYPEVMCRDGLGNVFVVSGCSIRKLPPGGGIVTWVGSPYYEYGDVDGNRTHARFGDITSCAGDDIGNILVVESFPNRIRRVSPAGEVTTLEFVDKQGIYDWDITDITFGGGNTFYVISLIGADIREITIDAQVKTIVERGVCNNPDTNVRQGEARNIEYDIQHHLFYVSCTYYINKVTLTDIVTHVTTPSQKAGDAILTAGYIKLSADTYNLFVSNYNSNTIITIGTQTYNTSIVAGTGTNSGFADGPNGIMNMPMDLVFFGTSDDRDVVDITFGRGNIFYVISRTDSTIHKITLDAQATTIFEEVCYNSDINQLDVTAGNIEYHIEHNRFSVSCHTLHFGGVDLLYTNQVTFTEIVTQAPATPVVTTTAPKAGYIKLSADTYILFVLNYNANTIITIDTQTYNTSILAGTGTNSGFADGPNGIIIIPMDLVFVGTSDDWDVADITFGGGNMFYVISRADSTVHKITLDAQATAIFEEVCYKLDVTADNIEYHIQHNQFHVSCRTFHFGTVDLLYSNKVTFTEIVTQAPIQSPTNPELAAPSVN